MLTPCWSPTRSSFPEHHIVEQEVEAHWAHLHMTHGSDLCQDHDHVAMISQPTKALEQSIGHPVSIARAQEHAVVSVAAGSEHVTPAQHSPSC